MIATKRCSSLAPALALAPAPAGSEGFPTPAGPFDVTLDADQTDGAYALVVATVRSQGGPPPRPAHPFGETRWVLDGELQFTTVTAPGLEHPILRTAELARLAAELPAELPPAFILTTLGARFAL